MFTLFLIYACIAGLVTGFGISLGIFTRMLDQSNNMGDSTSGYMHYTRGDIKYSRKRDDVGSYDRYYFFSMFGDPDKKEEFLEEMRNNAGDGDDIYMHPGMPMYKPDI